MANPADDIITQILLSILGQASQTFVSDGRNSDAVTDMESDPDYKRLLDGDVVDDLCHFIYLELANALGVSTDTIEDLGK